MSLLRALDGGLVVSCQPVDDGPMDSPEVTATMAKAAEIGGARGLRIEGVRKLATVRPQTDLPIIGIVKRNVADTAVRITPIVEDVFALADQGADIIAYDATARPRPTPTGAIVEAIKSRGALAMADCATRQDAEAALAEGVDVVGTTLSGYAHEIVPSDAGPDLALVKELAALGTFVMAEGRYNSPHLAAQAMAAVANCVTVGSAITRLEHITSWFATAIAGSGHG